MPELECESDPPIPPWGPPLIAFGSSVIRGLTGFGDGITYQSLWSLFGSLGALPSNSCPAVLRKTVLYAVLMQTLTMPLQVWQARGQLRTIAGYASVMSIAGALCVVGGALFLLNGDPAGVRSVAGVIFLVFSVTQLTAKLRTAVLKKAQTDSTNRTANTHAPPSIELREPTRAAPAYVARPAVNQAPDSKQSDEERELLHATALSANSVVRDEALNAAVGSNPDSAAEPDDQAAVVVDVGEAERSPSLHCDAPAARHSEPPAPGSSSSPASFASSRWCPASAPALPEAWFPRLSERFTPPAMLALLVPAAMAGGLLGGLTGAGGPPLMAAYALLQLDKDVLRGLGVVPSAFMVLRLAMYTGSPGTVFDPSLSGELVTYGAIVATACCGSLLGDRLRPRFDSEAIVAMLLVLVFVGSGLMLRLFQDHAVTAFYGVLTAVWCSVAVAVWLRPPWLARTEGALCCCRRPAQG